MTNGLLLWVDDEIEQLKAEMNSEKEAGEKDRADYAHRKRE